MRVLTSLLAIAICLNVCFAHGGQKIVEITPESNQVAINLYRSVVAETNEKVLSSLVDFEKNLLSYTTQVVSGVTHRMVFKFEYVSSPYFCLSIWQKASRSFAINKYSFHKDLESANESCGIANN